MSLIREFSAWLREHQREAADEGFVLDLVLLPRDAEANLIESAADSCPFEDTEMIETKDHRAVIFLNGVKVGFDDRIPTGKSWFRYTPERLVESE